MSKEMVEARREMAKLKREIRDLVKRRKEQDRYISLMTSHDKRTRKIERLQDKVDILKSELDACKGNLILMTEDRDKWLNQTIEDSAEIARLKETLNQIAPMANQIAIDIEDSDKGDKV
jgi:ABC-type transporter Mla maintaining outer membrane lipid asymmetry ATPase subunit MlaF